MWSTILSLLTSSSFTTYIAIAITCLGLGAYGGYEFESNRFEAFKVKTEEIAKVQEEHNKAVVAEQKQITEKVKSDYEAQIDNIKHIYASRVFIDPSSGKVSSVSAASIGINEATSDSVFIGQCAQTTVQLVYLQKSVSEQSNVK